MRNEVKDIKLVNIEDIQFYPRNRNLHDEDQIAELRASIKEFGIRSPAIISNQSGHLIVGEGRVIAAKEEGHKQYPVVHQDFKDEEEEYAYHHADNNIARKSELDLPGVHDDLKELQPFNTDLMFIPGFDFDPDVGVVDLNSQEADEHYSHFATTHEAKGGTRSINMVFTDAEFPKVREAIEGELKEHKFKTPKDLFMHYLGLDDEKNKD